MRKELLAFLRDEEGLTMVEYAIAGSLVAAGCVLAFTNLGTAITNRIEGLATTITGTGG